MEYEWSLTTAGLPVQINMKRSRLMDTNVLLTLVNENYAVRGEGIRLHRESAGRVYYINAPDGRKVLKLFRPTLTKEALQSAEIMNYLDGRGFPVVKIVPTISGEAHIAVETPEGPCVAILYEFAKGRDIGFLHRWRDGKQPLVHPKAAMLGEAVGRMHRLMDEYPGEIIRKGKPRYIDDFIFALKRDGCDPAKVRDLEEYGSELWALVEPLPAGFCHGDMHTGNTAYRGGVFTWMDFDRASVSRPVIDVGWLSDGTDFNNFDDGAFDRSRKLLDALYEGYSRERPMADAEIAAVLPAVAIIHYDLFAEFANARGETLTRDAMDEQHGWLMRWREACAKAR
jgi:Ser/Thr protein kinase RdoA (MazF antagonist)